MVIFTVCFYFSHSRIFSTTARRHKSEYEQKNQRICDNRSKSDIRKQHLISNLCWPFPSWISECGGGKGRQKSKQHKWSCIKTENKKKSWMITGKARERARMWVCLCGGVWALHNNCEMCIISWSLKSETETKPLRKRNGNTAQTHTHILYMYGGTTNSWAWNEISSSHNRPPPARSLILSFCLCFSMRHRDDWLNRIIIRRQ